MGCFGTVEKPAYTGSSGWLHRLARLVLTLKRVLEMFVISSWHAKVAVAGKRLSFPAILALNWAEKWLSEFWD
ncbi:hypothetical protein CRG98_045218 [Punica granatum]|uniref:Uncharacterized protein n=1 Tax=Punica granatum TaxID=22663 RepID=A0A2I0HRR5_PUNGR|nr:hypothetical protein CRG98_045218 [Punica granatum]